MSKLYAQLILLLHWMGNQAKHLQLIWKPVAPRILFRLLPASCQELLSACLAFIVMTLTSLRQLAAEALQTVYLSVCTRLNAQTASLVMIALVALITWGVSRFRDWWIARRASNRMLWAIAESDTEHTLGQLQPPPLQDDVARIRRILIRSRFRQLKQACRQYRQLCRKPSLSFHSEN